MAAGYEVLNPMGFDSFGLNAENAAIRDNEHPATFTYANIAISIESCKKFGTSFDWSRTFNTSDPDYYRWTQWLFLQFRERGLAYRKESPVNWCPVDQTVLANEQVIDGHCERCGAEVTKRELTQWYFKITDYAQELLDNLDELEPTWPDRVITAQRNWIGRSEGAHVDLRRRAATRTSPMRRVYTTRPDTLFGATFMVVAADAKLAGDLVTDEQRPAYEDYLDEVRKASEIERLSTDRDEDRRLPGRHAVNPVNGAADPDLGGRLRAGRLRHRRDHGRARPGPARLGLRRASSTCRSSAPCSRPTTSRARRTSAQGRRSTPPTTRSRLDGLGIAEAKRRSSPGWSSRAPARARSTSGCATGCCRGSATGARPIPIIHCPAAARCRCPTTSCRSSCPSCAAPT